MGIAALVLVAALVVVVLRGLGRIVSNFAQGSGQIRAPSGDKWRVSEDRSPMDDSRTVTLSLDADSTVQGWLKGEKPSLHIRCKEGETKVCIWTGMPAKIEEESWVLEGSHRVRMRLDDGDPFVTYGSESTAHDALFFGEGIKFPIELARAKTLKFEFTPFNANPAVARFDLRGLGKHLDKVAEACHWAIDQWERGRH